MHDLLFTEQDSPEVATESENFKCTFAKKRFALKCKSFFNCLENAQ